MKAQRHIAATVVTVLVLCVLTIQASGADTNLTNLHARYSAVTLTPGIPAAAVTITFQELIPGENRTQKLDTCTALRNPVNWDLRRIFKEGEERVPVTAVWPAQFESNDGFEKWCDDVTASAMVPLGVLKEGDKIKVRVKVGDTWHEHTSLLAPDKSELRKAYEFTFDPKHAIDQKLSDGTKKDAWQLALKLSHPDIFSSPGKYRVYFETDNLISTEKKDVASKVEVKLGISQNLGGSWYVPGFVEAKVQSNQQGSYKALISSAGLEYLPPLEPIRAVTWNQIWRAPFAPHFSAGMQYQTRLDNGPSINPSHAKDNLARLNGRIRWRPIYLLPSTKEVMGFSPQDVSLEIDLQGWYFPDEEATGGATVKKRESQFRAVLYIPVSKERIPASAMDAAAAKDGAYSRWKIEYVDGANEASAFLHSRSIMVGFEAITK